MDFGIFSNGFRPHTSAARTYDEDIYEIALADELGFTDAYISEHHGEPPHIGAVDTIPAPEFMMCKAAALTRRIRMGSAVKLIHLHHPLDVAMQAAITSHMLHGRYIFGFGSGFPSPLFSEERGLGYAERYERMQESLAFIMKCWTEAAPFDWDGKHWRGKGVVALPKPAALPQMATATETDATIAEAAANGWTLLSAFVEPAVHVRHKAEKYAAAARAAGRASPRRHFTASRIVYVAKSLRQAKDEMRESVAYEVSIQAKRGFLAVLKKLYGIEVPNGPGAVDALVESGLYILGDADSCAHQIKRFYDTVGGFGQFLIVTGKEWSTRENRTRSMRLFMEQVAPQLCHLGSEAEAPLTAAAS